MPGGLGFHHHHQHQHQQQQKIKKPTTPPPPATAPATAPRLLFKVPRDDSPDSVIFVDQESSNFSHFSSNSGSVDRCSFASDNAHDHQSLVSEISKHLAGRELLHDCSSGPDLVEPTRNSVHRRNNTHFASKGEKAAKVSQEGEETEEKSQNAAKTYYFSQALKECQERKLRSEVVVVQKLERGRPASLDLKNINNPGAGAGGSNGTSPSPRLTIMKKTSLPLSRKSSGGAFPSPGTPPKNYINNSRPGGNVVGVVQKGWSSERIPLPTNGGNRRNGLQQLPFNNNGKTLPSKWEDAEKWIFSPVAAGGEGGGVSSSRTSAAAAQPQRRPKAKSGPLGPPGHAYYSMYSPAMFDGRSFGTFMEGSPFSAGIFVSDLPSRTHHFSGAGGGGESHLEHMEPCIVRSASVHGWSSDLLLNRSSLSDSQDAKGDGSKDAATMVSPSVSRRDMATQMSPEGSRQSSPKERSSSLPPLFLIGKNNCQGESISRPQALMEPKGRHCSQSEVRDVQVDDQVTVTRWSKKHGSSSRPDKGFANVGDWRNKAAESQASAWEVAETPKSLSKSKREDAKITAWENLQKAKAEAAIRKLEMKLEKKRSSSMDKIMNKLKSAQKKAQDMRSSVSDSQVPQVSGSSDKRISFRKRGQIGSLSGCFTCHAS